jgi:Leucine-rich repeat (LRR) protein
LLAEHNNIASLPPEINILQSLRHVSLAYNHLRAFPVELCGIKTLDYVDLSHNKLVEVPEAVRELSAIEINLNQNQVSLKLIIN